MSKIFRNVQDVQNSQKSKIFRMSNFRNVQDVQYFIFSWFSGMTAPAQSHATVLSKPVVAEQGWGFRGPPAVRPPSFCRGFEARVSGPKDLSEVICYGCFKTGHYHDRCPIPAAPQPKATWAGFSPHFFYIGYLPCLIFPFFDHFWSMASYLFSFHFQFIVDSLIALRGWLPRA